MGKILIEVESHRFKWISNCLPLVCIDGGSPTLSGNITFILCISLYNKVQYITSEVVLNFFHHQHPPRLFLWLPRVSNSIQFLDQRNLSNDLCVFLRHLLWESKCSFKFWPPFSVPPALAEFTTSAIVPSYWMDGIHAVCLNNSEKSCHGTSKTRSFTIQIWLYSVHYVACKS